MYYKFKVRAMNIYAGLGYCKIAACLAIFASYASWYNPHIFYLDLFTPVWSFSAGGCQRVYEMRGDR